MSKQQKAPIKLRLKAGYRWKFLVLYFTRVRPRIFSVSAFASELIEQIVDKAIEDGEVSPISKEDEEMDVTLNVEQQYQELLNRRKNGQPE